MNRIRCQTMIACALFLLPAGGHAANAEELDHTHEKGHGHDD